MEFSFSHLKASQPPCLTNIEEPAIAGASKRYHDNRVGVIGCRNYLLRMQSSQKMCLVPEEVAKCLRCPSVCHGKNEVEICLIVDFGLAGLLVAICVALLLNVSCLATSSWVRLVCMGTHT